MYCREFRLVIHDGGILIFMALLPTLYPIVYSLIYNPEVVRDVRMVVVDHDCTPLSRELARNLDATQEIRVIGYAADMGEARRAMNSHECYGILEIPRGFGRRLGSGQQGSAVLFSDMSLLLRYRSFLVAATDVSMTMGAEIRQQLIDGVAPLADTLVTGDPMGIDNVAMGNLESGFDSFIMPGIVILILQQFIVLAVGMAGGAKRESPRLTGYDGVNGAPSVAMTLLGQALCYFTLVVVPVIFMLHYVPLLFSFPMAGDVWEIMAFILPTVTGSIMMGFCFQSVVWQRENVFVIWVVTSLLFLFLSGLTWPRYAMAPVWRALGDCVPATWGLEGFIRMNTNGADLSQVRDEYIGAWICAACYTALAYILQRWVVRPTAYRTVADRP